jgi:hypothetical protein
MAVGRGAIQPLAAAKDPAARPLDVVLLFDVEDIFSPPEVGNDDSIQELATILTEEALRGTFLFIGDRAWQLRERGRQDVIESLAPHEVGLHTRSARHPCSPEYVQRRSWDEGVAEALRHEREGVEIIREVFGRPACALSTHNAFATPHSQRAAALLGLPYLYAFPAAPPLYNVSWYAGALGLPWSSPTLEGAPPFRAFFDDFDDRYHDRAAFEAQLRRLDAHVDACLAARQPLLSLLLYHPQRVRLAEFMDRFWSPNGSNYPVAEWGQRGQPARYTPAQVKTSLDNFRRLARKLRRDPRLRPLTVGEVVREYGAQPAHIVFEELLAISREICARNEILFHERFSPAEILVALAEMVVHTSQHGKPPARLPRRDVLGPVQNLIVHPELPVMTRSALLHGASQLLDHVAKSGHLPAMLGEVGARLGTNHLHRAFAECCIAIAAGSMPAEILPRPMPRYPALAAAIGTRYAQAAEAGLISPDLDVDALYRHGKLQTWTLKPAIHV